MEEHALTSWGAFMRDSNMRMRLIEMRMRYLRVNGQRRF